MDIIESATITALILMLLSNNAVYANTTTCIGNINKSEPVFCTSTDGSSSVTIGNGNLSFTHTTPSIDTNINEPKHEANEDNSDEEDN